MAGCAECKGHIGELEDVVCHRCFRKAIQRVTDLEAEVRRLEATVLEMAKRWFGDGEC